MSLQQSLQSSVLSYLIRSTSGRIDLKKTISVISARLPDTVIFGGMLREFALGRVRKFSSDIDLVSTHSRDEIFQAISHHSPIVNKFGGFRFIVDKQRFDIWSFHDTWAFKEGHVAGVNLSDLLKTTFFNLDAAFYHISKRELELIENYESWIDQRILDINLRANPHPANMARRAISLTITRQLGMTKNLAKFVLSNMDSQTMTWAEKLFLGNLQIFIEKNEATLFHFSPQGEISN